MQGPTPLLNTVTLSNFTDLVEKSFKMTQQMITPAAKQLFIMDDISANTGETRRYDEVDTETFATTKLQGQDASKAQVGIGYFKIGTVKRIAKEIDITWEMRRYNKYPEVQGQLLSLTHFCPQRQELDLTHVFTFCNATSYVDRDGIVIDRTGGDGQALVGTGHTLAFSAVTYSNRVSGDPVFSQAGYEAALSLTVSDIYNNFGERRVMNFNTIVTSDDPNTIREVKKLLNSESDVDEVNPGIVNIYKSGFRHVILPYLATTATGARDATKKRWWFLVASGQGVNGWQAYFGESEAPNLKTPATGNNGEDFHNDNWSYGVRNSYMIVTLSGRGLIASLAV